MNLFTARKRIRQLEADRDLLLWLHAEQVALVDWYHEVGMAQLRSHDKWMDGKEAELAEALEQIEAYRKMFVPDAVE